MDFCIIIDSPKLLQWQISVLEHIESKKTAKLTCIYIVKGNQQKEFRPLLFKKFAPQTKIVLLSNSAYSNIEINYVQLAESQNQSINQRFSFIIDFAHAVNNTNIFTNVTHGIWRFEHSLSGKKSLFHKSFWEVYRRELFTRAALLRLTGENTFDILREGRLKTTLYSVSKTYNHCVKEASIFASQACTDLNNGVLKAKGTFTYHPDIQSISPHKKCLCTIKSGWEFLQYVIERAFFVDHWHIGKVHEPIDSFLKPGFIPKVEWLPYPYKNRFAADPFIINYKNEQILFFEELKYGQGKGYIVAQPWTNEKPGEPTTVIDEPFHLSYPYLIQDNDNYYCIPESNENNDIGLYKAIEFPYRWTKEASILKDFPGIDSTIFKHENRWWMFTSNKKDGAYHRLYAFYADSLEGPWTAHANNPVKTDICTVRGGGTPFYYNNELYRPGQDYSKTKEWRLRICKITALSPTEFEEEEITILNPIKGSPYPHKFHTLSSLGNITIIDSCRQKFILFQPSVFYFKTKRLFRFVLGKVYRVGK